MYLISYSLPLNTYQGADTTVFLSVENETVYLYASDKTLLTTHKVCNERGCTIRNRDHSRDKSQSLTTLQSEVTELLGNIPGFNLFVENIFNKKQRYLRDNLQLLKTKSVGIELPFLERAVQFCIENSMFNANTLIQTAVHYQKQSQAINTIVMPQIEIKNTLFVESDYKPQTSKINTYQTIMQ